MSGRRISQVDSAITDIKKYLLDLQFENTYVDFYITIIPFSTTSNYYNDEKMINIEDFNYDGIKTGGWSNLHLAYEKLSEILKKESKGGIMPDFGGLAPVILLLTDGHPTGNEYKERLKEIIDTPWFKVALRYGIAIELNDKLTKDVLRDFVGKNGDVIECYDSNMLKNIIKIIVLTASKVKSQSANVSYNPNESQNKQVQQQIAVALAETEDWEW
jgi:uncharacterized protein YegL